MTTTIDQLGQRVMPKAIRVSRKIQPGDDFEILADEDDFDLILLRRIRRVANAGLVRHLTACPHKGPLSTPRRRREPMRKARLGIDPNVLFHHAPVGHLPGNAVILSASGAGQFNWICPTRFGKRRKPAGCWKPSLSAICSPLNCAGDSRPPTSIKCSMASARSQANPCRKRRFNPRGRRRGGSGGRVKLAVDTNTIISGSLWPGPPSRLVSGALSGNAGIYLSLPMLLELQETLQHRKFAPRLAGRGESPDSLAARYLHLASREFVKSA